MGYKRFWKELKKEIENDTGTEMVEFKDQHWKLKEKKQSLESLRTKIEQKVTQNETLKEMGGINIILHWNKAEVLLDTSFESLYKHGYWAKSTKGIIWETLAAATIIESGVLARAKWEGWLWLWDPFCGSGTFLIEALTMLSKEPMNREKVKFCMDHWPVHPNQDFEHYRD